MQSQQYIAENPEQEEWDVVVIGTGMGGSTIGYALARRGRRVLFLEKGQFLFGDADRGDGQMPLNPDDTYQGRLRRGWWPTQIQGTTSFGELQFFAPLGCASGGTSGVYAAQLERFAPSDFRPREHHDDVRGTTVPDAWPVTYDDLVPYYREAERLYHVCGTQDPLNPDPDGPLRAPPPLSPRDQTIYDSFEQLGLHPYRAHIAYEFIAGCGECGGALCPRRCKRDAGTTCLMPALEEHGAKILPECDVLRLEADRRRVTRVIARRRGKRLAISARTVVLSAGAFNSPAILLRSTSPEWAEGIGNQTGWVGRNLMLHTSDFVAVRPTKPGSAEGPKKAMAVNDFYVVQGKKLGTFQSVGIPVTTSYVAYYLRSVMEGRPAILRAAVKPAIFGAAFAGATFYKDASLFATIVEDLPYRENRVMLDEHNPNGFRFEYEYKDELRTRNQLFRRVLSKRLSPHRLAFLSGANNLNFGHVCGTCRFGDDPRTSVLDANNRVHDVENLYVVDASFFPSSSGTNPSLTIAANALRVAAAMSA